MAQQPKENEFIVPLVAVALICGLAWVVWFYFHAQLSLALKWVRVSELWAARFIVGDNYIAYIDGAPQQLGGWRKALPRMPIEQFDDLDLIVMLTKLIVPPLRPIFAGALGLMTIYVIFFGPGTQFCRRMGLEQLMREQSRVFPAIAPFLAFDPRKQPFRAPGQPVPEKLPLFSEALAPEEWLAFHEVPTQSSQIDAGKAYQALLLQLGRRWQGPMKLPLHMQGLFAAFALQHVRKRKECEAILAQLALSWSEKKGFKPSLKLRRDIRAAIKNPKIGGALVKHVEKHAYETTALLRGLQRAREEGGVLAPAQFLWLRGFDRNLWYPLNNLGRRSYHAEAAGAMVHFTNELIAGQKIPTPRFDEVIKGIETFLRTGNSRTIPEKQKKKSKFAKGDEE